MQNQGTGPSPRQARKPRKRLAPSEKYEVFVQVLTQQATQREAAGEARRGPVHGGAHLPDRQAGRAGALAAAVPGRPGMTAPRGGGAGRGEGGAERLRAR